MSHPITIHRIKSHRPALAAARFFAAALVMVGTCTAQIILVEEFRTAPAAEKAE